MSRIQNPGRKKTDAWTVLLGLFVVFALSMIFSAGGETEAQTSGMDTPQAALDAALQAYVSYTGQTLSWQLGDVNVEGAYAYSIAEAENSASSEQGYVLLLANQSAEGLWFAVAPKVVAADEYNGWLDAMPSGLLSASDKAFYYQYSEAEISRLDARAVSLHYLPWPINETASVTQKDGEYHTNQIDFVLRNSNNVYASKPGVVVFVKEVSNVGGCDIDLWRYANMVVVQHNTTEYTWYLHLVQNSVTVEVGDQIGYGTKIGVQGNTGFSCGTTGIHLHYMSSTAVPSVWPDPSVASLAPWPPGGTIVPVNFVESTWAALTVESIYTSQNAPPNSGCTASPTAAGFYAYTYCSNLVASSSTSGLMTLPLASQGDNIESVNLPTGWSVALYEDQNEIGPSVCLNSTDQMLWDNLFNDGVVVANRTSWLRVYTSADCPYPDVNGIKFFSGVNFTGTPLWGMVGARSTNAPSDYVSSIYLPDGYISTIYDQDDLAGNSLCIDGSILNLGEYGWGDRKIESLKTVYGGSCQPPSDDVPQPTLVSPAASAVVWGPAAPEVCWSVDAAGEALLFNAVAYNDSDAYQSGWIEDACWTIADMAGNYGAFSWRVQAKNADGDIGAWSATRTFSYQEDKGLPTVEIMGPVDAANVVRPRTSITVNALDNESGVAKVFFFGWFDNGSGVYDWYYLGEDTDGQDGWQFTWNLIPMVSEDASLWAYAEDYGGNFASDIVEGVFITDTLVTEGGYGARGSVTLPEAGPELEEIPGYEPPAENTVPSEKPSSVDDDPAQGAAAPLDEYNYGGGSGEAASAPAALPAVSGIRQPEAGTVFYAAAPQLCWEEIQTAQAVEYQVLVQGEEKYTSPWISETCWTPSELDGQSGTFDWQVQVRSADGAASAWSERVAFTLRADTLAPTVTMVSPKIGGSFADQIFVEVEAQDVESGVQQVYFLAWYDAGNGAQWHTIGSMQPIGGDQVYQFVWDVTDIPRQEIQLWVYVGDAAQNFGYGRVESVWLVNPEGELVSQNPKGLPEPGRAD